MYDIIEEYLVKINGTRYPPDLRISEYSSTSVSIKGDCDVLREYIHNVKQKFEIELVYAHYSTRTTVAVCKEL